MSSEKEEFLRLGRQFRAFAKILCINGETFEEKLNGAIAWGLADVCELLAEATEQTKKRGFARMLNIEV